MGQGNFMGSNCVKGHQLFLTFYLLMTIFCFSFKHKEMVAIAFVLQRYELLYGQKVNFHKSEVVFNSHIDVDL